MDILEVNPKDYHDLLTFNREDIFDKESHLSKSTLWQTYGVSLWRWKNHPKQFKKSDAMIWGSLVDCLATTPSEFDDLFSIKPETYKAPESAKKDALIIDKPWSGNAKFCKHWIADQGSKDVITQAMLDKAHTHADILINGNKESAEVFAESKTQVILHTTTKEGVRLKGLADLVPSKDYLCDLKTCSDFSLDGFSKTTAKFGYHVQAGMYLLIWNNMHPDDQRKRFKFIWQDPETGEVAVTEMSADDISMGQAMFRYLYNRLIVAYRTNHFPTLTDGEIPVISRPAWAQMSEEILLEGGQSQ